MSSGRSSARTVSFEAGAQAVSKRTATTGISGAGAMTVWQAQTQTVDSQDSSCPHRAFSLWQTTVCAIM